jgi:hypothetical protein
MSDNILGEIFQPDHCQVSVSPERTRIALTFRSKERAPLTIVLPVDGVGGLQRKLAHTLYLLGVRSVPAGTLPPTAADASPDGTAATPPESAPAQMAAM